MTETTSKVEKWSYPLRMAAAEGTDPQQFYMALAKAKDGYYPIGANGIWHGGIHFDEDTGLAKDLTEVKCIADGEVVAYRIDESYPKSDYGSTQSIYSTGFVLVKHRLEVPAPPVPPPAQGAAPGASPAAGPSLTFYSLYMHLLDWDNYKKNPTLTPPGFWGKGLYKVKASAPDKALGLRVRSGNSGQHPVVAVLPRGTIVLTQPAPASEKWVKIVSVTPEVAGLPADTGWVFKGQLTNQGDDKYLVGNDAPDSVPGGAQHGANVRSAHTAGLPLSHLPPGTQIRLGDDATPNNFKKLVEIVSGSSNPALTLGTDGKLPGFVWSGSLEPMSAPHSPIGSVISLSAPFKIKAGQVLGHIGKYQSHSDASPKNLLHFEVFCCEDIPSFVTQSQSKAGAMSADQKNLMKAYKGTKLITHRADITSSNPPKVNDDGVLIGYDLVIPASVLEAMPAQKKIKEGAIRWWHLEGLLGDDQGNPISGWLREQDLMTTRHNPWEWEGFEFVEEKSSNTDHLAAYYHDLNLLTDDEKVTFVPKVSASTNGPVKERLYSIIDTDKNEKLTVNEIRAALAKPWFAQSISMLATKYESEWLFKAEKWDALDELMGHTAAHPNLNWVAEKKRIETLAWWNDLAGKEGLSADGRIWHIHGIGLIANFDRKKRCDCNPTVKVTRWKTHYGPIVFGEGKLGDCPQWSALESSGQVTASEKKIISVMCENEGAINSVQAYDSEIVSAGAMQKTMSPDGAGEFPTQVERLKNLYPDEYLELFESQGWYVYNASGVSKMYYQNPQFSGGEKLEGDTLRETLRLGCNEGTFGGVVQCKPMSALSCAVGSPSFVEVQILDFIDRLRGVLLLVPKTYHFTVGQLFLSELGRATALDERVNRPGNVVRNIRRALDKFFKLNPSVSKDVSTWGDNHAAYESKIVEIYGKDRPEMTEPEDRYQKIKDALNV
ncbi:hypothetical protein M4Z12_07900 [Pseudomonas sp. In614]|uniref:hypothetical protein n=1 Tax=Pseudomonas nunensis TaxID=2961896 RepID=UPI0006CE94C0|nr:hypothetical protein [Pseudomonas nunensis]MCL5226010.1 hypothetical protein [Pseudomonas nunensis]